MYPGRGDDDAGFIFIVLDDLRDYIHRCVLTEPRAEDEEERFARRKTFFFPGFFFTLKKKRSLRVVAS